MGWPIGAVAGGILTSAWAVTSAGQFIEAWYSPPVAPMLNWCCREVRVFTDQTIRQVVKLEGDGRLIRVPRRTPGDPIAQPSRQHAAEFLAQE